MIMQKERIEKRLSTIKAKVAIYSGKGGVGKTTITVNLACVLAGQGKRVGILDADIDCPNVVRMMKASNTLIVDDDRIIPAEAYGVKVVSMAFLQPGSEDEAIVWRGPLIHKAITELLEGTDWGDLDYLLVDLPPGTSDAPLTIMQNLPLDGFVIVTTPQELARLDAKRSVNMIRKMGVTVVGGVENFTGDVFGAASSPQEFADQMTIPYLGALSMRADYSRSSGPAVLHSEAVRKEYEALVTQLEKRLAAQPKG
jgi:ATP-binding protein involved in chromosome partitioning